MPEANDTLGLLLGEWSLERVLEDHLTGVGGRFDGVASIRRPGGEGGELRAPDRSADAARPGVRDAAIYEERGRIAFGAHQGPSRRTLSFNALATGAVAVHFADGRPFFELDLRDGHCEIRHPCRADQYRMSFELRSEQVILERWNVRGPQKSYDAETVWRRLTEASSHRHR